MRNVKTQTDMWDMVRRDLLDGKRVFLDMDGVLVDTPQVEHYAEMPTHWWVGLKELWFDADLVKQCWILSAPCSGCCLRGKWEWCKQRGLDLKRLILTESKYLLANEWRVLYDDWDHNILDWERSRGVGVLVESSTTH